MLDPKMYYTITKYYIINIELGGNTYTYRKSKLYYVTGIYYQLSREYTTEIAYELNVPEENNADSLNTGISGWFKFEQTYPIYLQNATVNSGIVKANGYKDGDANYLKFSIDPSLGASGKASINDSGTISINQDFGKDEYIKVNIYMAVSGNDRALGSGYNDDATYILLGSVRLGLER